MTADRHASTRRTWRASQGNARSNSSKPQEQHLAKPNDWQRSYEHYRTLAENTVGADRVTSEQHWQHAEHFRRLGAYRADLLRRVRPQAGEAALALSGAVGRNQICDLYILRTQQSLVQVDGLPPKLFEFSLG